MFNNSHSCTLERGKRAAVG